MAFGLKQRKVVVDDIVGSFVRCQRWAMLGVSSKHWRAIKDSGVVQQNLTEAAQQRRVERNLVHLQHGENLLEEEDSLVVAQEGVLLVDVGGFLRRWWGNCVIS